MVILMQKRTLGLFVDILRLMGIGCVEMISYFSKMEHHAIQLSLPKPGFIAKKSSFPHGPLKSPDLNPIEQLWEEMKKRLEHNPCKNLEELKAAIFQCWEGIESQVTKNLVSSMPKHCSAVIAAKGGHTKY